jgi:phosphoenolpyruvate carboxykinase (GTP)
MWPGFGENSRVLKWIVERLEGTAGATDTAIGRVPSATDLDLAGLDIDDATVATLLSVDNDAWRAEISQIEAHFDGIGTQLPAELRDELRELEKRLAN